MEKIKQITPNQEAETCWNYITVKKQQLKFHYFIDII